MFSAILRLALFAFFCLCRFPSFALLALWGGVGWGGGGGLNDVLFRGQAYAAIIKSTTRGKEHATNETTTGGGRGRRHTHPPPAGRTYERITKQPSPCKPHHQATITIQTSSPSNHHHANINTKQPSPCKHHHQATITMNKVTNYTYYPKPLPIKVFSNT